jgi:hypothetical protein
MHFEVNVQDELVDGAWLDTVSSDAVISPYYACTVCHKWWLVLHGFRVTQQDGCCQQLLTVVVLVLAPVKATRIYKQWDDERYEQRP